MIFSKIVWFGFSDKKHFIALITKMIFDKIILFRKFFQRNYNLGKMILGI